MLLDGSSHHLHVAYKNLSNERNLNTPRSKPKKKKKKIELFNFTSKTEDTTHFFVPSMYVSLIFKFRIWIASQYLYSN